MKQRDISVSNVLLMLPNRREIRSSLPRERVTSPTKIRNEFSLLTLFRFYLWIRRWNMKFMI